MILEIFSNPNNSTHPRGTDVLLLPRFCLDTTLPWCCLTWEGEVGGVSRWNDSRMLTRPWCPTVHLSNQESSVSQALSQAGSFDSNELWESDQCQMCRFLLSKAGAVGSVCTSGLTSTADMYQIWGLEVLGLVVLSVPGEWGSWMCLFTEKSDLPQLIDRIYFSWCTAVQTIIYYLSLHYSLSMSPPSPHCACFACALPGSGSGSGSCSNSCLL